MTTGSNLRSVGRYGSVGIELVLSVVLGFLGGRWLDGRIGGGHGWLTILGVVVGLYAGFRAVFKAAKAAQREMERLDREEEAARRAYLERARRGAPPEGPRTDDSPR
jgi:F0F1-type ATP synthase assembly protein I